MRYGRIVNYIIRHNSYKVIKVHSAAFNRKKTPIQHCQILKQAPHETCETVLTKVRMPSINNNTILRKISMTDMNQDIHRIIGS